MARAKGARDGDSPPSKARRRAARCGVGAAHLLVIDKVVVVELRVRHDSWMELVRSVVLKTERHGAHVGARCDRSDVEAGPRCAGAMGMGKRWPPSGRKEIRRYRQGPLQRR